MDFKNCKIIVVSDVNERDGIGIEVYYNDKIILEVFRDDTDHSRTISLFQDSVPLEIIEHSIKKFKEEILWDFID